MEGDTIPTETPPDLDNVALRANIDVKRKKRKSLKIPNDKDSISECKLQPSSRNSNSVPADLNSDISSLMKSNTRRKSKPSVRASKAKESISTGEISRKRSCTSPTNNNYNPSARLSMSLSPTIPTKKASGIGSFMSRVRKLTDSTEKPRPSSLTLSRDIVNEEENDLPTPIELSEAAKSNPKLKQRELIVHEIISTEEQYLSYLTVVIKYFLEPIRGLNIPKDIIQKLFGNIEVIHNINSDVLKDLKNRQEEKGNYDILVGDIFLKLVSKF